MANTIKGITIEIDGKTDKLTKALESTNKSIRETSSSLKDVNKLLKVDPSNVNLLKQKQELLANAVEDTKKKLDTEKKALEQLKNADQTPECVANQKALEREIIATEQALASAKKESKEFGSVFKQQMENAASKVADAGSKIEDVGKKMTVVSAAIGAVGASTVKTSASFESAMSQVAATMGYSVEELNTEGSKANETISQLGDFAKEMGKTTSFSATEAADALNYMALAGYSADQSMEMLPTVLNLAAAGGVELATASDMITDAQSALGLSSKETATMVDQMAKTSAKSNTSVAQLGEAILTVGASAKGLKGGTKELNTLLGVLADNGTKGAEGGTALRNILASLNGSTKEGAAIMEKYTNGLYDSEGNMRDVTEVLGELRKSMEGMTEEEKTDIVHTLFNKADWADAQALIDTTSDRYLKLGAAIQKSEGSAQDMADVQLDNFEGQVTLLKSAMEGLSISIGEILMPFIKDLVKAIQGVVDWLNSLDDGAKKMIVVIAAVVAAIGPLLVIIGTIMQIVSVAMTVIPLLAGPVGIVIAAIVALIAIIALLVTHWEQVKEVVSNVFNSMKEVVESVLGWIGDRIKFNINCYIGYLNLWLKAIAAIVNVIVGFLNKIQVDVPEWVPEIGGKKFGFDIPKVEAKTIPYLASGAVIPPNKEFLAMLGDQKNGNNIEAPESLIRQIVSEESNTNVTVVLQGDASKFFKAMQTESSMYKTRTGLNAF